MNDRKVLVVSPDFPPIANQYSRRALKLVKYLGRSGWDPVVLTVHHGYGKFYDSSMLAEITAKVPQYHARELDLRTIFTKQQTQNRHTASNTGPQWQKERSKLLRFLRRLALYFIVPDLKIGWIPFAYPIGLKAIQEQKVDLIYTMFGYGTSLILAYYLSKKTCLPLVIEYEDPWFGNKLRPDENTSLKRLSNRLFENKILQHASTIIFNTESIRMAYTARYGLNNQRTGHLTDAYDLEDFENPPTRNPAAKLTFTHSGDLYGTRNPKAFLKALANSLKNGLPRDKIAVNFVGQFDEAGSDQNRNYVRHLQLEDVVNIVGYVSYEQSVQYLMNSDILLLITHPTGSEDRCPGKLFEYLAAGKTILALTTDPAPVEIILKSNLGEPVDPTRVDQIQAKLQNIYSRYQSGFAPQPRCDYIAGFSYERQADQLSDIFTSALQDLSPIACDR